jgi:hypothetical protein
MKRLLAVVCAVLLTQGAFGQNPGLPGGGVPGGRNAPGGLRGAAGGTSSHSMIKSDMALMEFDGSIPMRFANALDGQGIPGAEVALPGVGTFTTDQRGIIALPPIRDGTYTITFSKSGFITTPIEFKVQLGRVVFNWFSISPGLNGRAFRFVLDWGERPSDLDIHLEKRGEYHISYYNLRTSADGNASLDRDDTSGYGPETITVTRAEGTAIYDLYIINYSDQHNPASDNLSRSGAVLRVYGDDRLLYTLPISQGPGIRWNVLRIEGNQIHVVNTITR